MIAASIRLIFLLFPSLHTSSLYTHYLILQDKFSTWVFWVWRCLCWFLQWRVSGSLRPYKGGKETCISLEVSTLVTFVHRELKKLHFVSHVRNGYDLREGSHWWEHRLTKPISTNCSHNQFLTLTRTLLFIHKLHF